MVHRRCVYNLPVVTDNANWLYAQSNRSKYSHLHTADWSRNKTAAKDSSGTPHQKDEDQKHHLIAEGWFLSQTFSTSSQDITGNKALLQRTQQSNRGKCDFCSIQINTQKPTQQRNRTVFQKYSSTYDPWTPEHYNPDDILCCDFSLQWHFVVDTVHQCYQCQCLPRNYKVWLCTLQTGKHVTSGYNTTSSRTCPPFETNPQLHRNKLILVEHSATLIYSHYVPKHLWRSISDCEQG